MTDFRIHFTESGVSLPDGTNCGVQGEHNAVQLVIMLPGSMIDGCDYHVITFTANDGSVIPSDVIQTVANADGAYRDGRTIYQPLTAAYTGSKTVEIVVTGYKQDVDHVSMVDRTKPVSLWFTPVPGFDKPAYPSGLETNVKGLMDEIDAIRSEFGDADNLDKRIADALGKAGCSVDTYVDLLKEPFTLVDPGTKVHVRGGCLFDRFGYWHGERPEKNSIYSVIYFSPELPPIGVLMPDNVNHDYSAVAYFERENEDVWRVELSFFEMLGTFAVMLTDRSHANTDYSHYYYLFEEKTILMDGVLFKFQKGWNHGYLDAETDSLVYEPSDAPAPIYDVKCTDISVVGTEDTVQALMVFAMACRPNTPYFMTMPRGVYVKLSENSWAMTNDSIFARDLEVTVKRNATAWSYNQQTVSVPGTILGDRVVGTQAFVGFSEKFNLTGMTIRDGTITFTRDPVEPLPDADTTIWMRFIAADYVIPKSEDIPTPTWDEVKELFENAEG